ncbi:MAG: DUF5131 family protein [Candidatus Omnitrophica bacterium]|nr:DUF5131 family protein [Candidatus Omnitrophota bacterium]
MNNIKKTIGYADLSWNPVTGCLHHKTICGVKNCYAKRLAEGRLRGRYGYYKIDPFDPTVHRNRFGEPIVYKKPSRIFVSDMGDLFGDWTRKDVIEEILNICKICSRHTFLFLTKNPKRYLEFSFSKNCWLGTTINRQADLERDSTLFDSSQKYKTWVSFEPLYEKIFDLLYLWDWVVIGGQSSPHKDADKEGMEAIIKNADSFGIPIWLKENVFKNPYPLRQELPGGDL